MPFLASWGFQDNLSPGSCFSNFNWSASTSKKVRYSSVGMEQVLSFTRMRLPRWGAGRDLQISAVGYVSVFSKYRMLGGPASIAPILSITPVSVRQPTYFS